MAKQTYPIPKASARHTDLGNLGRWLAPELIPYAQLMRLDRPVGYWLLVLPSWFAILLGSNSFNFHTLWYMLIFLVGAVALRGAGCIINDLWDRDLDRWVSRTLDRPLASGILSGRRAIALFTALISIGILVLLFLPWRVWFWALASLPLIVLYPLAKRYIQAPQIVLGLTFSWGVILGWLTVQETLSWQSFWLYAGTFFWILYYDTIYATQDMADDHLLKLNSMPLLLGEYLFTGIQVFACLTLVCWVLALSSGSAGFLAWLGLFAVGTLLLNQLLKLQPADPIVCLKMFKSNVLIGQVWCLFLILALIF